MGNSESLPGLKGIKIDKESSQVYNDFTVNKGELNGLPVTVFSATHPLTSKKKPYIQKALQASRVYRHPGLLKYIHGEELPSGEILVITEEASPLQTCHQSLSPLQLTSGLSSLINTLIFLHDTAGVSHNNINLNSIFITPDNTWKLWGLEYCCSFSDLTDRHLSQIKAYCHQSSIPPDNTATIVPAYQHARDVYAFAALVDDLLVTNPAFGGVPGAAEFVLYLRNEAQHADWRKRPRMVSLQRQPLLKHDFLQLHHNLTNLLLMVEEDRETFLGCLVSSLRQYPEKVVACSLLPTLLSRPLLLVPSAAGIILPAVLTPDYTEGSSSANASSDSSIALFSKGVYEEHVVPHIVDLFSIHDLPIRELLLHHLPDYLQLLPREVLKKQLLPEILLGVQDVNEKLVCHSLRALAILVPVLGASEVVGKKRLNIFMQTLPKSTSRGRLNRSRTLSSSSKISTSSVGSTTRKADHTYFEPLSRDLAERSSPDGGEQVSSNVSTPLDISSKDASQDKISYKHSQTGFSEIFGDTTKSEYLDTTSLTDTELKSDISFTSDKYNANIHASPKIKLEDNSYKSDGEGWSDWEDDETTIQELEIISEPVNAVLETENLAPKFKARTLNTSEVKAMTLNTSERAKTVKNKAISKGLGEEFDIHSIEIAKKPDTDLDLFADLAPNLNQKKFDLEKLLLDANKSSQADYNGVEDEKKIVDNLPSVVDTMESIRMHLDDKEDYWGETDGDWLEDDDVDLETTERLNSSEQSDCAQRTVTDNEVPCTDNDESLNCDNLGTDDVSLESQFLATGTTETQSSKDGCSEKDVEDGLFTSNIR